MFLDLTTGKLGLPVVWTFPTIPKKAGHPNEEGQNLAERIDISLHLVYHGAETNLQSQSLKERL